MPFPLPKVLKGEITSLNKRYETCQTKLKRSPRSPSLREEMTGIINEACQAICDLDSKNSPILWSYVDALLPILREGVEFGIEERRVLDILEYLEQYDAPVTVEDTGEVIPKRFQNDHLWPGIIVGPTISYSGNKVVVEPDKVGYGTEPWNKSMNRNRKSSPLARFRTNLPALTPSANQPLASSVYNALCEISPLERVSPSYCRKVELIKLRVTRSGTCLALLGAIGSKTRFPWIGYNLLDNDARQPFAVSRQRTFQTGLAEVTSHIALDESRKLILVADKTRVKSFVWGDSKHTFKQALPTHTLDSWRFEGPILSLPNGTILRAGRAAAAVWVIDDLETHGPAGKSCIGEKLDIDDYYEDDEDGEEPDIEESGGTTRPSHIFFNDEPTLEPDLWERLPESSTIICADPQSNLGTSGTCLAIDFEHNGKTVTRFKGHRSAVSDFSTNTTDPRFFLTGCWGGYARMFDMRQSYPVVEFKAGDQNDCCAVALAYPDGIPTVFTGTSRREQIKVWDVRARACIYELATGNNSVKSLDWNARDNTLFALTACSYNDKSRSYQYRRADIPQRKRASHPNNKQRPKPRCWPRQAWHAEDYFEYAFDAGEDRVYRYEFKKNPDRYILPEYGDAQEDSYTANSYDDDDSEMGYGRGSDDEDDTDDY